MNKIYGIVVGGMFYSGRMRRRLGKPMADGIYSIDMDADDFISTMESADIADATRYFRSSSRMEVVRGIAFKDGFVPENPIAYGEVPITVIGATYDDFDEIEAVRFDRITMRSDRLSGSNTNPGHSNRIGDSYYFLQVVESRKLYILMDIKAETESKTPKKIDEFKDVTPEMRIAYVLHMVEKRKREEKEPAVAVKLMMEEVGAIVENVKATNRGFEVSWHFDKYRLLTIFDKQLRVVHAGYCVRMQDGILSPKSIVNVLKDGIEQHGNNGLIHTTVAYDGERFGDQDEEDDF